MARVSEVYGGVITVMKLICDICEKDVHRGECLSLVRNGEEVGHLCNGCGKVIKNMIAEARETRRDE